MRAVRNWAGLCSPARVKYALTVKAKEVATRPGFQPPYQALTMMATENTTSRLSTTSESRKAGIRARVMLRTATPYRRIGARAGGMKRLRRRGSFARIQIEFSSKMGLARVTGVHPVAPRGQLEQCP